MDETDADRNRISWRSPLAKALLKAPLGGRVSFRAPVGEQQLQIVGIGYETGSEPKPAGV